MCVYMYVYIYIYYYIFISYDYWVIKRTSLYVFSVAEELEGFGCDMMPQVSQKCFVPFHGCFMLQTFGSIGASIKFVEHLKLLGIYVGSSSCWIFSLLFPCIFT